MFLSRRTATAWLSIGLAALPLPAFAGGFYLQEQSPKETGRALSGAGAAADDPSAIYFNPAAMTELPGVQLSAGVIALFAEAGQQNQGSYRTVAGLPGATVPVSGNSGGNPFGKVIPVPSFYVTGQVTDRLWLGLGATAPFGLKLTYDDGFFGRYDSTHTDLKTYNVQGSAAYKLDDNFSIGGGVDVQHVKVTLANALPQLSPLAATDGLAEVKGKDWTVGWHAGLFYTNGDTNIGISYRSGIDHRVTGTRTISGLQSLLAAQNGSADVDAPLNLPDIVTVGFMHRMTPRLRAMVSARWYNWSVMESIVITAAGRTSVKELDYKDSYSVSLGGEYDVSPALTVRAGTMFDRTPTNPQFLTTRVPDGDRAWLSAGATYNVSPGLALNLSYAHNFVEKATIVRPDTYYGGTAAATTVTTLSRTSGNADQIAASVTARF